MSSWQVIAAKGFTFCLPPGWQGRGGTRRQGRTSLSWGTGAPPPTRIAVVTREVVRPGERPMPPEPPPGSEVRRFSEQIDGRTATLWRSRFDRTYYIGAQWDAPSVWLTAETPDAEAPDLVLNIARTVRFVSK